MLKLFRGFIDSIKVQLSPDHASYKKFIVEETNLGGKPFSFYNHEYQEYITDLIEANPGKIFVVSKCSQIGLSELFNRIFLARMAQRPFTGALVSFPSKLFSQEVFKTRISGVINESPKLSSLLDHNNDSASVKALHNGSIAYALGGSYNSNTSLLNRPIDTALIDELDRQDPDVVSGYRSRMTHTPAEERLIMMISTPTADGVGIDAEIKEAGEVHTPYILCKHCQHEFVADFYENIIIPGYDEPLILLTKAKAARLPIHRAYLECPNCKAAITQETKETVWKVEHNPEGVKKKIGITIDPFAAMGFITIPDLVESSTEYTSHVEFLNQGLGKTAAKGDSQIDRNSINFTHEPPTLPGSHIFGLDFGKECHWMHGILKYNSTVHVIDTQIIKLSEIEDFLEDQQKKYTFAAGVMDSQPYSDLVYKLIRKYPRLFSAIYVSPNPPIPEMYKIKMTDKFDEIVRQVTINKSLAMDSFAGALPDFYTFQTSALDASIAQHFTDMRRVRDYRFSTMQYKWIKSAKGVDHFWHTAIYLFMAAKLATTGMNTVYAIPVVVKSINPDRARARAR